MLAEAAWTGTVGLRTFLNQVLAAARVVVTVSRVHFDSFVAGLK